MKYAKSLCMVSVALVGLVLVTAITLHAQGVGMRVNIPFEFNAAGKVLPAGTYIIERRGDALLISDRQGHAAAALANPIKNKAYGLEDMVVFRCYGESRFLSEVRWSETGTARGLMPTAAENKLAKVMPTDTVQLAAVIR